MGLDILKIEVFQRKPEKRLKTVFKMLKVVFSQPSFLGPDKGKQRPDSSGRCFNNGFVIRKIRCDSADEILVVHCIKFAVQTERSFAFSQVIRHKLGGDWQF